LGQEQDSSALSMRIFVVSQGRSQAILSITSVRNSPTGLNICWGWLFSKSRTRVRPCNKRGIRRFP